MHASRLSVLLGAMVFLSGLVPRAAHADGNNTDACGSVLCLAGAMSGADGGGGGSSCSQYEQDYFSIARFHNGHFDQSGTSSARGDFLNQCSSVDGDQKSAVNSKYGAMQSGP